MNLILFTAHELKQGKTLTLDDQRYLQIRDTHRATIGDTVRVGQLNGQMGQATILSLDNTQVILDVTLNQPPPAKLPLIIVLALPRPKMLRRIFRTVAELGISELHIINSAKVEKSFWQSPALKEDKIRRYLMDGLQQAKDTLLPPVHLHRLFKPFVEDQLPDIARDTRQLLAHPNTALACPSEINSPVTLAIGPEGGFTEYEVEKFSASGFEGIHLGPRILRVENAITALASKLYTL